MPLLSVLHDLPIASIRGRCAALQSTKRGYFMLTVLGNWKTTIAGTGAALTAAGHLLTHLASGDTSTLAADIPLMLAGIGLIFGKDFNAH